MSSVLPAIEVLEERLRRAMLDGDVEALDELLAPEMMFAAPDGGMLDKASDLETHRCGALKLHRLDIGDRRVQNWGDCVVVCVEAELEGVVAGQSFAGRFRYTRVWLKRDNRWQIVAGHASSIGN